nr:F32 [uncultured bacterium]
MAAEADRLALFFKILDSIGDGFGVQVFIDMLNDGMAAEPMHNRNEDIRKASLAFEKSHALHHGHILLTELWKMQSNERTGCAAALQAILAQLGDLNAEIFCAEVCLHRYLHAITASKAERSRRLTQALGWLVRSAGGCSMTALRMRADDVNGLALLQGFNLIAQIKNLEIDSSIFEQIIDPEGIDIPVIPGRPRFGIDIDGCSDPFLNSLHPVHKLPEYLCGQIATTVYDSGYESPLLAAGVIASKVKRRFPKLEQYCDQIVNDPGDSHAIWDLADILRESKDIDAGEEIEALLAVLASIGDKRAMLESAAFAVHRAYHDGRKDLLEYALGALAVASGVREVSPDAMNNNAVQSAIGQAGRHLVGKIAERVTEGHRQTTQSDVVQWLEGEQAAADERRQDEADEAAADADTDTVVDDDDDEIDRSAKPNAGSGKRTKRYADGEVEPQKSPLQSIKQISDRQAAIHAHQEAAARAASDRSESIKIIGSIGNQDLGSKENKDVVSKFTSLMLPRKMHPMPGDLNAWRAEMTTEFPHATAAIDAIFGDLVSRQMSGRRGLLFRPTLLVGDPGTGKSRLGRRLAESAGVAFRMVPCGGVSDSHFSGVARGWSSGHPSHLLDVIRSSNTPNPLLIMDEIEKVGQSRHNGNLIDGILSILEPETSARWTDPFIQGPINISCINWLFTANTIAGLPAPLLDRLRIVHIDAPSVAHLPALSATILKELATAAGHASWLQSLDDLELAAITRTWRRNRSLRFLRRLVEGCLKAREQAAMRH